MLTPDQIKQIIYRKFKTTNKRYEFVIDNCHIQIFKQIFEEEKHFITYHIRNVNNKDLLNSEPGHTYRNFNDDYESFFNLLKKMNIFHKLAIEIEKDWLLRC
jgi:hypothetical protein